jgi:hypothetical protein
LKRLRNAREKFWRIIQNFARGAKNFPQTIVLPQMCGYDARSFCAA